MDEKQFASYLDEWLPRHQDEIVSCLMDLLAVPSVGGEPAPGKPFGEKVDDAFNYYIARAASLGLVTKNVDAYAVHSEIGSGPEMVMALTHVDVVPAGKGWTRNPWGEVSEGKIFGRGAQDNKGPTVACLYALKALKDANVPLKRRVRHVVGGNEESGFRCVRHYFEVEEKPTFGFSPDAYFPLVYAEKGSMNVQVTAELEPASVAIIEFSGGDRPNVVPQEARALLRVPVEKERGIIEALQKEIPHLQKELQGSHPVTFELTSSEPSKVEIRTRGKACHASTPWEGANAIRGLAALISRLAMEGDGAWEKNRQIMDFIARAGEIYGKCLNIACEDDVSGKLTCNLGVATTVSAEPLKLNIIYNIRYPVKATFEELMDRALNCPHPPGIFIEVKAGGKPHYTDPNSFLVKTLLRVYREETGDFSPPIAIGGGTYAKVIPGGVAFGPVRPGTPETAHQADEFLTIEDLVFQVRVYARALFALAT